MNDEKIIEKLEEFKLPIGNRRIYENELDNYNYFIFRRGRLIESGCNKFVRQIQIIYAFTGEQKISDFDIINKIKELNLIFVGMDSDDVQIADTNDWIDLNIYTFERPERGDNNGI